MLLLHAFAAFVFAQALNPDFVFQRDYTFERMEVTRDVNDAADKGTIRLVAYVYRPLKNDRHQVVLFSHGSVGGMSRSPREPFDALPFPVVRFFVSRGYTLVAPMRRGRGESTGKYIEECAFYAGKCTAAEQLATGERGVPSALADTNTIIDKMILGRLAPRDSKIIAAGISRGGFLSLVLAGERPSLVEAVVNFAGGWHGVNDRLTKDEFDERIGLQKQKLTRAAKLTKAPTIWIYADRDPFYNENARQQLLSAWREGGGQAEYLFVAEHSLQNGHMVASNAALWEKQLGAFMNALH